MIPGSSNPLMMAAAPAGGYQVSRSLRFNSSDSGFCSRTPAVAGNRTTWTWAGWVKRSRISNDYDRLFGSETSASTVSTIRITMLNPYEDCLEFHHNDGTNVSNVTTAAKLRDPSAWYHIVVSVDTTQSTSSNRTKIYINGVQQTLAVSNYLNQNVNTFINSTNAQNIGRSQNYGSYFNGYMADIHFIDGQALTPSSFTEVSATTGQLIPKTYSGSFGTNGFWLKFSDNSAATAATLGKDYSGNSNNWTPNNLSVTAGAGNDSLVDTPTSYGTDTGVGGSVRGNYCTWNPLDIAGAGSAVFTVTNGNLDINNTGGWDGRIICTMATVSGQYYYEITLNSLGAQAIFFFGFCATNFTRPIYDSPNPGVFYAGYGDIYKDGVLITTGAAMTAGDVIGIAFNATNGTASFYKNGTLQGAVTGIVASNYCPAVVSSAGGLRQFNISANFGQRPFAYTAPSGFKALCDTNLPAPVVAKPNTVMDVALWTGNNTARTISGLNFSPDLVWIKNRSTAQSHTLYDTVRGATLALVPNGTDAELTLTNFLTAFTSDGFSIGTDNNLNGSGNGIVGWAWDAGTSTASNTAGSITSQVRANVSAGFSVQTWTASGSGIDSWGHGLGIAPEFVIAKRRSSAQDWYVWHKSITSSQYLLLNSTASVASYTNIWGASGPSSSLVYYAASPGNQVSYAFAPVVGFSSFGSYTGNGSADGPFVYNGFRPRWVLIRRTDTSENWILHDTARDTYNVTTKELIPNSSGAEGSSTPFDILSNGFKMRDSGGGTNGSGGTYIYAAFAENPFQYARAR